MTRQKVGVQQLLHPASVRRAGREEFEQGVVDLMYGRHQVPLPVRVHIAWDVDTTGTFLREVVRGLARWGADPRVHMHVTRDVCELAGCDLAGYHFHWRGRVHRRSDELDEADRLALDEDCHADGEDAEHDRERARW